jgi:hypothetical protein
MEHPRWQVLLAVTLLLSVTGCPARDEVVHRSDAEARERGRKAAEADIAAGQLAQKEYPALPYSKQHIDYLRLLKSECGVNNVVVNAPGNAPEIRAEVAGYNEVMSAEIRKRFGDDIFQKLHARAEAK